MGRHICGLIDDRDMFVLVEYVKREIYGDGVGTHVLAFILDRKRKNIPRFQLVSHGDKASVHKNTALAELQLLYHIGGKPQMTLKHLAYGKPLIIIFYPNIHQLSSFLQ